MFCIELKDTSNNMKRVLELGNYSDLNVFPGTTSYVSSIILVVETAVCRGPVLKKRFRAQ